MHKLQLLTHPYLEDIINPISNSHDEKRLFFLGTYTLCVILNSNRF